MLNTPVASQDSSRLLLCLVEGEYILFSVTVEKNSSIYNLKKAIQTTETRCARGTLKDVDAYTLELWKVNIDLNIHGDEHSLSQLKGDREGNEIWKSWNSISHYWPEQPLNDHLHVIVKIPAGGNRPSPKPPVYERYRDCFIRMKGSWEFNGDILALNAIYVTQSFQQYKTKSLDEYREDLQKRRAIHPEFNDNLIFALGDDCLKQLYDPQISDESERCEFEMRHMNNVVAKERDYLHGGYWNENEAYCFFFGDFARYLQTYMRHLSPSFGFGSDSWPYTLVVYRDDVEGPTPHYDTKYLPKSDFSAILQGIPRIIMEVRSDSEEDDEKRMLAQGASLVRLINKTLVEIGYKPDFILMAIYFCYTTINRYLLCQSDESDESDKKGVYCFEEQFLNNQWDRARLLQQMYNLASKEEDFDKLCRLNRKLATFSLQVGNLPAYTSMKQPTEGSDSDSDKPSRRNRTQYNQSAPFEADGYDLVGRVPALMGNIYIVRRCKDRKQLVAKVTRDSVDEEILEFLHTRESPCEYIIPLIGSFSSNKGPGILLPIRQPVLDLLARPGKHRSRFIQFGEDLIKGLAFIHSHCVAHRDIKPDNLVYSDTFLLQIIDFETATQVLDSDDLLEEEVGTNGYMAPETRDRHSPIRADRWSCGLVILRFLESSDGEGRQYKKMEQFAHRLKDEDPWCRPSLCEWIELSEDEGDENNVMEESSRKKQRVED